MLDEIRDYVPQAFTGDEPPLDREKVVRRLEQLMHLRFGMAEGCLQAGDTNGGAIQLAFSHIYLGLIEQIRMGAYDLPSDTA